MWCAQFCFFRKRSGNSFPATFFVWFFKKNMFLIFYYFSWLNSIVLLPSHSNRMGNMSIAVVCFPGSDVINVKTNLIFLIKPFFYMTKKSKDILRTKGDFKVKQNAFFVILKGLSKIKCIFHHLKRAFSCQKLSQTWECFFMFKNKIKFIDYGNNFFIRTSKMLMRVNVLTFWRFSALTCSYCVIF